MTGGRLGRHTRRRRQTRPTASWVIGRRFSDECWSGKGATSLLSCGQSCTWTRSLPLGESAREAGKLFQQYRCTNLFGFGCELDKVVSAVQAELGFSSFECDAEINQGFGGFGSRFWPSVSIPPRSRLSSFRQDSDTLQYSRGA